VEWRPLEVGAELGVVWRRYFLASLGTLLPGQGAAGALIVRVLACRAKGLGLRGPARVCEGKANPVLQGLVEAAEPPRVFSRHYGGLACNSPCIEQ
jgi:hypothetical protein